MTDLVTSARSLRSARPARSARSARMAALPLTAAVVATSLLVAGCSQSAAPTITSTASASVTVTSTAGTSTAATPSSPTAAAPAAPPTLRGYTFPAGMVDGNSYGGKHFSRIEGVVAIPSTAGPHPVAVIVHGSYPGCIDAGHDALLPEVSTTPWPEACGTARRSQEDKLTEGPDYVHATASVAYLARELAARGFVAVAIDVHAKEELGWGGEPEPYVLQTALVKLHLSLLGRMSAGESLGLPWAKDLTGQVDTTRIALVGHSSGAGYAASANARSEFPALKAIVALQPALNSPFVWKGSLTPSLVVSGQCDEQVGADEPLGIAKELAAKQKSAVVITASVARANHIGLVAGGGSDQIGLVRPLNTGACATKLAPATAQGAVARLTADFLETALAGGTAYTLGVSPDAAVTLTSATPAATVTPRAVTTVPTAVDPRSITFDVSTTSVVPPKPADVRLINADV